MWPAQLGRAPDGQPRRRTTRPDIKLASVSGVGRGIADRLCDFCNARGFFFGGHSAGRIFRFDVTDLLQRMYYSVWGCLQ